MNSIWARLRLASSQLPIGGYSYSQGLEAALDNGWVRDAESARTWLVDQLQLNLARFEAPLLAGLLRAALIGDWAACDAASERHRASRETRELAQESRQMGFSLHQLLEALPELDAPGRAWLRARTRPISPPPGRWPHAPGAWTPRRRSVPGSGAGWKTSWRC